MDDVAIFNKALSEQEINEIMKNGLGRILALEPREKIAITWGMVKSG